jgi:hypothetical protein
MAISSVILSFAIYDNEVYSALQKQKISLARSTGRPYRLYAALHKQRKPFYENK